jgi:ABC-type amino acid transport substrate-binding protein
MSRLLLHSLLVSLWLFSGGLFAAEPAEKPEINWQGFENCEEGRYILPNLLVQVGRSRNLSKLAESDLKRALDILQSCNRPVILQGHADRSGSDEANRHVASLRVQQVHDWLVKNGLKPELIQSALGLGAESLPYPDQPKDAKNRTVVFALQAAVEPEQESVVTPVEQDAAEQSSEQDTGVAAKETLALMQDLENRVAQAEARLAASLEAAETRVRELEAIQVTKLEQMQQALAAQTAQRQVAATETANPLPAQIEDARQAIQKQVEEQLEQIHSASKAALAQLEDVRNQPSQELEQQLVAAIAQLQTAQDQALEALAAALAEQSQALQELIRQAGEKMATAAVVGTEAKPAQALSQMPPDIEKIKQRGKIVVAMLGKDVPPFFMKHKDGGFYGLDVKLAEGIAAELGVELEFNRSAMSFNDVVQEVIEGRADLAISKISRTLARGQKVLFSRPYIVLRQGLLFNRLQLARAAAGKAEQEFVKNLVGPVAVIQHSSYEIFLKSKFPQATVISMPSWDQDIIPAVVEGRVMAAYRDELEVKKIIRGKPKEVLRLKTVILKDTQDPIAMVLPHGSYNLQQWINIYLDTIQLNYTADTLLDEYEEIFDGTANPTD